MGILGGFPTKLPFGVTSVAVAKNFATRSTWSWWPPRYCNLHLHLAFFKQNLIARKAQRLATFLNARSILSTHSSTRDHFFKKGWTEGPFKAWKIWTISRWWFQPVWKICLSNWIISPSKGENKKYLKPPPKYIVFTNHQLEWWSIILSRSTSTGAQQHVVQDSGRNG